MWLTFNMVNIALWLTRPISGKRLSVNFEVHFGVKVGNSTFYHNVGMLNTIGPVTKLNFGFLTI